MTVFTEGRHAAEFLIYEDEAAFSREAITIAAGSGVVKPGTVCGEITGEAKFAPSPAAEVVGIEGAEVATALPLYEVDATLVDVKVAAIVRHAVVNVNLLSFDPSVDTDAEKAAKVADLEKKGIIAR